MTDKKKERQMKFIMIPYRLGALGVLLSVGVFFQDPLASSLQQNPSSWLPVAILFGFAGLAGLVMLSARYAWLQEDNRTFMFVTHGAALISIIWLIFWCFDWLVALMTLGDKAEMFIKHTSYLHLFGVGFAMAGYATGWLTPRMGERSARFLMTMGWAVFYMAAFNLFLQPALKWLWALALGGLLAAVSAFFISRGLRPVVSASEPA
jgi:hypothetical protein